MRTRYPILGLALILIGIGGLLFVSALTDWGRGAGWGPGMMGPGMGPGMMGGWFGGRFGKTRYSSNGERIYYTGVSARTGRIPVAGGPMWFGMRGGGCVACHGVGGRGGVPVMMGGAIPADIRYAALTAEAHHEGEAVRDHPPYTDALIKRGITQGLDPAGNPLDWTMPRWRMAPQDLDEVVAFLKTLR